MGIKDRIEKLEQHTGADKPECKTWVVVEGEPVPDGIADGDAVIKVTSERARDLVLRVMAGEGT
jgi:hypothetical protein